VTAAEKTRVGRAERPGLGQYIGAGTTAVDFVRLGRRRVEITTEEAE